MNFGCSVVSCQNECWCLTLSLELLIVGLYLCCPLQGDPESDPQQVVHRVALRVSSSPLVSSEKNSTKFDVGCVSCKHIIIVPVGG